MSESKHTPKSFGVEADTKIITRCINEWIMRLEAVIRGEELGYIGLESILETIKAHKPMIITAPATAADRDRLAAENAELRRVFNTYGFHLDPCPANKGVGYDCNCGFDKAVAAHQPTSNESEDTQ